MNKKSALWILLELVFLIVFNTVFFVAAGTDHVASVWLSYGFIHFAYLMVLITPFLIQKSSQAVILGFSLYAVSATYFLVEFITGIVFIILKQDSIKTALIVQIIIAGLYAILLLASMIINENTAQKVAKHEEEVSYIKNASANVKALMGKSDDKQAEKAIEKLYDLLHSSPAKSSAAVRQMEKDILSKIAGLGVVVNAKDSDAIIAKAGEVESLIMQRNQTLKTNQK